MNKENFIKILHDPHSVSPDELKALEQVVEQYPYFQTARSAIASACKRVAKNEAPKKLSTAAIYTTNRNLLKKYVSGSFDFSISDQIKIGEHRERLNTAKYVDTPRPVKKQGGKFKFVHKKEEDESKLGSGKFVDLTKQDEEYDYDEEIVEKEDGTVEEIFTRHRDDNPKLTHRPVKQEIEEEAESIKSQEASSDADSQSDSFDNPDQPAEEASEIKTSAPLPSKKTEPKVSILEVQHGPEHLRKVEELVKDVFNNLTSYQKSRDHYFEVEKRLHEIEENEAVDLAVDIALKKATNKIEAENDEEVAEKEEKPIKRTSRKSAEPKKPEHKAEKTESDKKEAEKDTTEQKTKKEEPPQQVSEPLTKSETSSNEDKVPTAKAPTNEKFEITADKPNSVDSLANKIKYQQEIIERFIQKNPKIVPDDDEAREATNNDLSLQSVEMKDDFATENLAQILAKQGKRDKAIEIYEKLILKNPRKKSYFASRISELK